MTEYHLEEYRQIVKLFVAWNENFIKNRTFAIEMMKLLSYDYNIASDEIYHTDSEFIDRLLVKELGDYKV